MAKKYNRAWLNWLASPNDTNNVWNVNYNGNVNNNNYDNKNYAARPVVCLESDIPAVWEDGMWKLITYYKLKESLQEKKT